MECEIRLLELEEDLRKFKLKVVEVFLAHKKALHALGSYLGVDISKGNLLAEAEDMLDDRTKGTQC